jgi:cytochrome c-type biogenesis protein CcmH
MLFWVLAGLMSAGVALALLAAPRRAATAEADPLPDLIRAKLDAVESDIARGTLSEAEAAPLRAEIKRRLLRQPPKTANWLNGQGQVAGALVAISTIALTLIVYLTLGRPDLPDQSLDVRVASAIDVYNTRPSQAEVVPAIDEFADDVGKASMADLSLIARLREVVAARPTDREGLKLLANSEASLGNFAAAAKAQGTANELAGPVLTDEDLALQAMWMVQAAQDLVTPEAEAVIKRALDMNSANPTAKYYLGLLYLQIGRPDIAYSLWLDLYETQEPDSQFTEVLNRQLPIVAELAGTRFTPRDDLNSAPDVEAPDIGAMITSLKTRLAEQGGEPGEWAMLIRSLMISGDFEGSLAALEQATNAYADDPEAQALFQKTFDDAGVIGP